MNKLLIVVGPTATGKTDLAIELAKKFNGELVSCDSRQVYRGLDLISGKIPSTDDVVKQDRCWIVDGVNLWMVDMVDVDQIYSVSNYIEDARKVLKDIWSRDKLPIIVGGSGYYLRGLLEGFGTVGVSANFELREKLEQLSVEELQVRLRGLSPEKWEGMKDADRANRQRLVRAIEVEEQIKGKSVSVGTPLSSDIDMLEIGLDAPVDVLREKIRLRIVKRMNEGMLIEAKNLYNAGLSMERMDSLGLECRYLAKLLSGELSEEEMIAELGVKIAQYAKRQRTWFRVDKQIKWFDVTTDKYHSKVENMVADWYN